MRRETNAERELSLAEEQSYQNYLMSELRRMTGEHEWLAHKTGFRDGMAFAARHASGTVSAEASAAGCDQFPDATNMMRFEAAKAAMQGILSNSASSNAILSHTADRAIEMADMLLSKLNKTEQAKPCRDGSGSQ